MCLHNINAKRLQSGLPIIDEVAKMVDKIPIGSIPDNYEELIDEAETMLYKYGKNRESATIILKYD